MRSWIPPIDRRCFFAGAAALGLSSTALAQQKGADNPEPKGGAQGDGPPIVPAQGVGKLDIEKLFDAKPTPATAKTTYVRGDGGALIAKVVCELEDDERLVKLPTGELEVVAKKDTRPTDRPFRSASRSQVIAHWKANKFSDFKFVASGYYIFAYQGSEAFYRHTRSILETMMAGVIQQLRDWGLEPKRPDTPMLVIIMPNRQAFDALEKMPPGVAAYYSQLTNYVVLYEDTRLWEAAPEFAFKQAAYTIAHEGIHQILANTGIQQRLSQWPSWISEGLPEYFCPLRVNSRLVKNGNDEAPERTLKWNRAGMVNDMRMYELLSGPPSTGTLIRTAVSPVRLTSYGYAVSWGLVHYLSTRKAKEFAAYLQEISTSKTLDPLIDREHRGPDPFFVKHFGDDFPIIELGVKRHLTNKKLQKDYKDPVINQTVYLVTSTYKKGGVHYTVPPQPTLSPVTAREMRDRFKKQARAEGHDAHVRMIVCDNMNEARYHITKIMGKFTR